MKSIAMLGFLLTSILFLGCDRQPPPRAGEDQPVVAVKPSQPEEARAYIQQYIDRLLGGDETVRDKLLGMDGIPFGSIDDIQITSALPAYSSDGKKLDNWVVIALDVRGYDKILRRTVEKRVSLNVLLNESGWRIRGSGQTK